MSRSVVDDAQARLGHRVRRTPVVRSPTLDERAGARLWLKAENLQRGGSFKLRGALLAVERLAADGAPGVIAQSTGNHAIAVALAAGNFGLPAELILPRDAAATKIRMIRQAGADVVFGGNTVAERAALLLRRQRVLGFDEVTPYDDLDVIAGQATASAELLDQVTAEGQRLDALVVPVGGGSALAGACLAASGSSTSVFGAEPLAVPSLTEALRAGRPISVDARATIADGLRPDAIGQLPFDLCRFAVSGVHTVTEAAIADAVGIAFTEADLLIEPAAAAALAAALTMAADEPWRGRDIGVLITGGNVDPHFVSGLLGRARDRVAGDR